MEQQIQIFISYAREDQKRIEGLASRLVAAGYQPWLDRENIIPGLKWEPVIKSALKKSDFVVVCLSETSINKRGFLQKEIKQALEHSEEKLDDDVWLIPARLDDCDVPESLSHIQWVDLFEEDGIEDLLRAIKYQLKRVGKNVPPPIAPVKEASAPPPVKVESGEKDLIEMVSLPGGEFTMGGTQYAWEKPPHRVRVSPFAIGKYQVTQAQWKTVMGEGNNPSGFKGDNLPVENVSWEDAQEFIKRLNDKTGQQYRLPTEAEWEYAARAGSTTEYCFGDDESRLGEYAWYDVNSGRQTHPVGQKKPNGFGLYDMHGNVWEWCADWFSGDYYKECHKQGVVIDPQGPASGTGRVARGGGWSGVAVYCRSAVRIGYSPGARYGGLGFRLVRIGR